jgi:hypothetical protein
MRSQRASGADPMHKIRNNTVDFNSILMGFNFLVACLIISAYSLAQNNDYIDQQTIVLGLLLSVQTHIALQLERTRRDPFVILLAFITIFYFSLRIYTLALYPFSMALSRYSYGPEDSNYALLFIIIANCFIYAGFLAVKFKKNAAIDSRDWKPAAPARVVVLMVTSLIYSYFSAIYWTPEEEPRIVGLVGIFISPPIILLMALSYFILFRRTLDRKAAIAIGILITLEIVAHTLSGSRSGIATLLQNIMLAVLAISTSIKIRKSHFILGCALAPGVLALLVGTFAISTFNRANREAVSVDLSQAIQLAGEASSELSANSTLEIVLPPIFDRAGFFDYSAEIIAHADIYKEVFNLSTYAKSIVDNLLTPGFDVYDQPKISNTLHFVYDDSGVPSKAMITEAYQSDQFGIYGELYALFGYASLPLFFLIAFLLKRLYVRLHSENPFALAMMRLIVLSVFVKIVNSYGMDWTIIETLPFVVAIYLYKVFFRSRRLPRRDSPGAQSGFEPLLPHAG